ncbi:MAG: DUF1996 domain-containing protein [Actinomycetota bacterium]
MRRVVLFVLPFLFLVPVVAVPLIGNATHLVQGDAVFQVKCEYSHSLKDDPIVFPGQAGASHLHDFFSARSTDANTTTESLMRDRTTCSDPLDLSAYWMPAVYDVKGNQETAMVIDAYYTLGGKHPPIKRYPLGLRMIAGDAKSTSPQPLDRVLYRCADNRGGQTQNTSTVPTCDNGWNLIALVKFPDCWDGKNLDSADHKSHMTYSGGSPRGGPDCPSSHPVPLPELVFNARFGKGSINSYQGGPGTTLASGSPLSLHADFWNAWDPARQQFLVDACLNGTKNCDPGFAQGQVDKNPPPEPNVNDPPPPSPSPVPTESPQPSASPSPSPSLTPSPTFTSPTPSPVPTGDGTIQLVASDFTATHADQIEIRKPPGAAGRLLLAVITARATPNIMAPEGWLLVRRDESPDSRLTQAIFVRIGSPSDPDRWVWRFSGEHAIAAAILAFDGVNLFSPFDAVSGRGNGASTQITAPGANTTVPGTRLVGFFGIADNSAPFQAPDGMTEIGEIDIQADSAVGLSVAQAHNPAPGATGNKMSNSSKPDSNVGQLIALRPA